MLNKPKFMSPSTNLQECTIDVNAENLTFSCIVDGNEAVYAWRIRIYRIEDNIMIYDTGKIDSKDENGIYSPIFFPVNEKNQSVVFSINLKQHPSEDVSYSDSNNDTIVPAFENNLSPYYWTIEFWNKIDAEENNLATTISCEEAFYANTTPEVKIQYKKSNETDYSDFSTDEISTVFTANKYTFKATYSQEENIPVKRYGWRITDIDSGEILLDTISHNQIYGMAENILCTYDGFLNGRNYSVEVCVETQNNIIVSSSLFSFSVSYQTTFLTNDFTTENLPKEAAILNSWSEAKAIEGKSSLETDVYIDSYPVVGNGTTAIHIQKGQDIIYDYGATANIDITEDSYVVLSTQLLNNKDTLLFFAEGIDDYGNPIVRKLTFESMKFKYTISDTTGGTITEYHTPSDGYQPGKYVWYVITMAPCSASENLLTVVESRAENGKYPSEEQYPSTELFPSFGEWVVNSGKEVETE